MDAGLHYKSTTFFKGKGCFYAPRLPIQQWLGHVISGVAILCLCTSVAAAAASVVETLSLL